MVKKSETALIQEGVRMAIEAVKDEYARRQVEGECAKAISELTAFIKMRHFYASTTLNNMARNLQTLHDSLGKREGKRNG